MVGLTWTHCTNYTLLFPSSISVSIPVCFFHPHTESRGAAVSLHPDQLCLTDKPSTLTWVEFACWFFLNHAFFCDSVNAVYLYLLILEHASQTNLASASAGSYFERVFPFIKRTLFAFHTCSDISWFSGWFSGSLYVCLNFSWRPHQKLLANNESLLCVCADPPGTRLFLPAGLKVFMWIIHERFIDDGCKTYKLCIYHVPTR